MIRIAVCDDEKEICLSIEKMLIDICREYSLDIEVDLFFCGKKLCDEMKNTFYDLIFLDIELPDISGVEIGKYIRELLKNEKSQIAYISSKEGYALKLFDYRPINFLVKPILDKNIRKVIDKYQIISKQSEIAFEYKKGREYYKIPLDLIIYFENHGRKVSVYFYNNANEGIIVSDSFYDSIDKIYNFLKPFRFVHIHKSIIVNYNYLKRIGYESVSVVSGKEFPISQSRRQEVRNKIMEIKNKENE